MTDESISDAGIAVMCDIARSAGADVAADKKAELDRLVASGFVEHRVDGSGVESPGYAVTRKGQRVLDARGVGVNES
jgi:hypothetical protein